MSLRIVYAEFFRGDVDLQQDWYSEQQDVELGLRYVTAVKDGLKFLAEHPHVGPVKKYRSKRLAGVRLYVLDRPFQTHLLFYKVERRGLGGFPNDVGISGLPTATATATRI